MFMGLHCRSRNGPRVSPLYRLIRFPMADRAMGFRFDTGRVWSV
jgi:hypothetical protein